MRRLTLLLIPLLVAANTAGAETFSPAAIAPELGIGKLTRAVARDQLDRELFSNPYSGVVLANIDIYEQFPFLESRYFQIVSDPGWNRLLLGETGKGLFAFDGEGTSFGKISEPHGLSLGENGRIYLADTGNNRILVLDSRSEFDRIDLVPVGAIEGLHRPYDVSFSNAGTPEDVSDDRLYVAETGRNRVVAYSITSQGYRQTGAVGDLGSGPGHFAGPMALAVGRADGAQTPEVYVADAHNRRIVRLHDTGKDLEWAGSREDDFDVATSLDTDHWGNVYAAGPDRGVVKYTADLVPLAELPVAQERPRSFHVVFASVNDHTRGSVTRSGQSQGVILEDWDTDSGIGIYELGVEVKDLSVTSSEGVAAGFLLTDAAEVSAEIVDPATGRVVAARPAEKLAPGTREIAFNQSDLRASLDAGSYLLRVTAKSRYEQGGTARVETEFQTAGIGVHTVTRPLLLGNRPNPFRSATQIQFLVPEGPSRSTTVRVFDTQGRLVRDLLREELGPGLVSVDFDGRDASGTPLGAGIYFYRVTVGDTRLTAKMILIR